MSNRVIASGHPDIPLRTTEAHVLELARQMSLESTQQDESRRSLYRSWNPNSAQANLTPVQTEVDVLTLDDWVLMDFPERMNAIKDAIGDQEEGDAIPKDLSLDEQLEIAKKLSLEQHKKEEERNARFAMQDLTDSLNFELNSATGATPRRPNNTRATQAASSSPARVQNSSPSRRNPMDGLTGSMGSQRNIPGLNFGSQASSSAASARLTLPAEQTASDFPSLAPSGAGQADDEYRKALELSKDPSEQMSDEMQQMLFALEESKREQREEEAELQRVIEASKQDFAAGLASYSRFASTGSQSTRSSLRPIVVDGNNVAFHHGKHQSFSAEGLRICLEFFRNRGHENVTIFVNDRQMTDEDREICDTLHKANFLFWVPKRSTTGGVYYDDKFFLQYACRVKGVVVSNDRFRDFLTPDIEEEIKDQIKNRTLSYMFVNDIFMPPAEPKGRGDSTTLDQFLRC